MGQALRSITAILAGQDLNNADFLTLNWGAIRREHVEFVRQRLIEQYSPATANRMLSALRGVLKEAWQLQQMRDEEYLALGAITHIQGDATAQRRALSADELGTLVQACRDDPTLAGRRDLAIIALLYSCGLRRSALVALNIEDCDLESGRLRVESHWFALQDKVLQSLRQALAITERSSGPLFVPILKSGRWSKRRMKPQSVYDILRKRAQQAGIAPLTPSDFRHTFRQAQREDRSLDLPV